MNRNHLNLLELDFACKIIFKQYCEILHVPPEVAFKYVSTEMPEEPYDPRSLFERLQEQKDKKQMEFEESVKFSKKIFFGVIFLTKS